METDDGAGRKVDSKSFGGAFDNPAGFYNNEPRFFRPTARFGQESAVTPSGSEKSSSTTPENPNGKRSSQMWAFASEGLQIAITLLLGIFLGYYLDARWNTSPWLTLGGALVGIAAGMFNFLRHVLKG